jgi:thiamine pyrophosphokinase
LIFAGAPLEPTPRLRARLVHLQGPIVVVAADRGAATALAFGFRPDLVVGDFDSLDPSTLEALRRAGIQLETHPRDKDQIDGQLAIERALERQPEALVLLGFVGGPRFDQTLATLSLLTRINLPTVVLDARNELLLLHAPATHTWPAEADEIVSLVPFTADAVVTTDGLRWPLRGETLRVGDTRGISNEPVSNAPRVEIASGSLIVARHFPS